MDPGANPPGKGHFAAPRHAGHLPGTRRLYGALVHSLPHEGQSHQTSRLEYAARFKAFRSSFRVGLISAARSGLSRAVIAGNGRSSMLGPRLVSAPPLPRLARTLGGELLFIHSRILPVPGPRP